eukprot:6138921-Pyramimonas_sp.AAC.1
MSCFICDGHRNGNDALPCCRKRESDGGAGMSLRARSYPGALPVADMEPRRGTDARSNKCPQTELSGSGRDRSQALKGGCRSKDARGMSGGAAEKI